MKVLFLQIAAPAYEAVDQRSNVPLAAGNLASFANGQLAGSGVEVTILDRRLLDRAGDAALVREIVNFAPDVVAATLYCWSSYRTLDILARARRARPGMFTIVGGPEADKGNDFLTSYAGRAFDLAAGGEGEEVFVEVLKLLTSGGDRRGADFYSIPGTGAARGDGELTWNEPRSPVNDLTKLPSPYLTKAFSLDPGGIQHIETARGCVFECEFCFYHADFRKVRIFPRERVAEEIRFALDAGVSDLYLMDPTFNGHSGYRETLRALRPELYDRGASVHTELRAEPMNTKNVGELYESGITSVEVGLQTITPGSLAAVGRTFERERFANGCRALLNGGIAVEIGTIVGLPDDSRDGMLKTFEYAKNECGEEAETVPFVLSLLPATVLRERAAKLNIRYRKYPPYTLLESPTFNESDIRGALSDYTEVFDRELDPISPVRCVERGGEESPAIRDGDLLRRIFISLQKSTAEELRARARELAPRVESTAAVIFRNITNAKDADDLPADKILAFLRPIREENPHCLLEVILELDDRADAGSLARRLRDALPPIEGHYFNEHFRYIAPEGADLSLRIVFSLPESAYYSWGRAISASFPVLWRCNISSMQQFHALADGPFNEGSLLIGETGSLPIATILAEAGDDGADLRFVHSAAQRASDAGAALPPVPLETIAILGEGARVAAVRRGL